MTADELAAVVLDQAEREGIAREELALRILGHTARVHPVVEAFARVLAEQLNRPIPLSFDGGPKAAWWRWLEESVRSEVPCEHFFVVPWSDATTMLIRTARNEGFAVAFECGSHRISVRDMYPSEALRLAAFESDPAVLR